MTKLIRTTGIFPPGSFIFTDRYTGKGYTDTHTTFDERVKQIVQDRTANARLFKDPRFLSPDYVADELSSAICARLNNDPTYCTDGSTPQIVTTPTGQVVTFVAGKVCRRCGSSALEPVYCATCSGSKILSYKCTTCGNEVPR